MHEAGGRRKGWLCAFAFSHLLASKTFGALPALYLSSGSITSTNTTGCMKCRHPPFSPPSVTWPTNLQCEPDGDVF